MTSAVPSQLLPTNITSRRAAAEVSGAAVAAAGAVTVSTRAAATEQGWQELKAGMTALSSETGS